MIEPLDEIPLWNKRHSRSFVNAALELSLAPIQKFRLYEKYKETIAELQHEKEKG